MLNLRGYRALCQNSGRHWRRNAQCPHAIDHARSQSVSHETSYVGLWAQPINGSGNDCGLCTTPLSNAPVSIPCIQYTASGIESLAMFAVNRTAMTSRARETWKKKRKAREDSRSTLGKRWKIDRKKHLLLHRICMLRVTIRVVLLRSFQ